MAVFETFSKRLKKAARAGKPDVFQYEYVPREFCVQVIHIWVDALCKSTADDVLSESDQWWKLIHGQMTRELGVIHLSKASPDDLFADCQHFIQEDDMLHQLDLIELSFRVIDRTVRAYIARYPLRHLMHPKQSPDEAIEELNQRFLEHSVGYEFVGGELIRKDSQFLHAEAVRPALQLLTDAKFTGASEEFLRAHEHYRHGRFSEAIQEANKAFESTLKTICKVRKWPYKPTDAAKALIRVVISNGLIPNYLSTQLPALATLLESGLPTVRNKEAGHGAGDKPTETPRWITAYALHLAASNIVMLVEAHRAGR